jgi:rare lipoprotein A
VLRCVIALVLRRVLDGIWSLKGRSSIALLGGALLVQGCTIVAPVRQPGAEIDIPQTPAAKPVLESGKASWYGRDFAGKPTASGEIFDENLFTAAHRTLPLGTKVKVTNVANGKSVEVKINDRGPFSGNRIIDLSRAAARALGIIDDGVAEVRLEPVSTSNRSQSASTD